MTDDDAPEIERLWAWIDREVPSEFWTTAGHLSLDLFHQRYAEIPDEFKPLAQAMIQLAFMDMERKDRKKSCLFYRCMLVSVCKKLDIALPYYWYVDGIMVEPEWIVRITNGIVGWVCDESIEGCGLDNCRYRDHAELSTAKAGGTLATEDSVVK